MPGSLEEGRCRLEVAPAIPDRGRGHRGTRGDIPDQDLGPDLRGDLEVVMPGRADDRRVDLVVDLTAVLRCLIDAGTSEAAKIPRSPRVSAFSDSVYIRQKRSSRRSSRGLVLSRGAPSYWTERLGDRVALPSSTSNQRRMLRPQRMECAIRKSTAAGSELTFPSPRGPTLPPRESTWAGPPITTEAPRDAVAAATVEAIVTAAETATEAEGMVARGAMAAAAVTGADRLVRTTEVAAEVATGGRAPGPTPHVEAGAIPTTTESAPSRAGPISLLLRTISE